MRREVPQNFYKQMFVLVIPMAIQNLINVGVSSSDIIMLGKVSENAMSSVSIANQFQFIMSLIMFGIASGSTVLNAQYWGKRNIRAIEMVLGISLRLALLISTLFAVVAFIFPNLVMGIFTNNLELINLGSKYLQIVAITYIIQAITIILLATLKSMEMVLISTIIYAISFFVNVIINYCLIFGVGIFPSLGVRGAAVGTTVARFVELFIAIGYLFSIRDRFKFRIRDLIKVNKILNKDFYKFAIPIVINELMWSVGMASVTAIYGHISESLVAANSVAQVTRQLLMVFGFGISTASALVVGKKIGEKNKVDAEIYAYNIIKLVLKIAFLMSVLLFVLRPYIIRIFTLSEQSRYYLDLMLLIICLYSIAQAYSCTVIIGIFRAGGDSKYGMFVDIASMFFGSLLLAYIGAFWLKLPAEIVIILVYLDEFIKIPLCYFRYKKKIWLNDITREGVENEQGL